MTSRSEPMFTGVMSGGRFVPDSPESYRLWRSSFKEGAPVEVILRKKRRQKSVRQQNYYRGYICRILGDHLGYTSEEMHRVLQAEFFLYTRDDGLQYIRSTKKSEWTTVEWEEKVEEIIRWAAEFHGVVLLRPDELDLELGY